MGKTNRTLQLILGPPGTGKTHDLLNTVDKHINDGVHPSEIAFVSFTKKAANEAAGRAVEKFKLNKNDFPYFRTLHSMAYQHLGLNNRDVMGRSDYKEIAALLGVEFTGYSNVEEGAMGGATLGDRMLSLVSLSRARCETLEDIWQQCDEPMDWHQLQQFNNCVDTYKHDTGKTDFNDMLDNCTKERIYANVKVAIIDEAQDLSNAQWNLCKVLFRKAQHIYIAGDDDQAIFHWSGASIDRFLHMQAERKVLPITYRLPRHIYAKAVVISKKINNRYAKQWRPLDDCAKGKIVRHSSAEHINISTKQNRTWMLLARNSVFLSEYENICKENGLPYTTKKGPSVNPEHMQGIKTWSDLCSGKVEELSLTQESDIKKLCNGRLPQEKAPWYEVMTAIPDTAREYYRSIKRAGNALNKCKDIYIGTIHSVKGGEADNVVIKRDITYKTAQGYELQADNEHRTFYVGITRTKKTLHIVDPQSNNSYLL